MGNKIMYGNKHELLSGELKIDEKELLDHLDGVTNTGELISKFDDINIYWNYAKTIYTLSPHGSGATSRDEASYIRYEFIPFGETWRILINTKNDKHSALAEVKRLRKED